MLPLAKNTKSLQPGSLKNTGGAASRPLTLHMGGQAAQKGGKNPYGSPAKPQAPKLIAPLAKPKALVAPKYGANKLSTSPSVPFIASPPTGGTDGVGTPVGNIGFTGGAPKPTYIAPGTSATTMLPGEGMPVATPLGGGTVPVNAVIGKPARWRAGGRWYFRNTNGVVAVDPVGPKTDRDRRLIIPVPAGFNPANAVGAAPAATAPTVPTVPTVSTPPAGPTFGSASTHDIGYSQALLAAGQNYDLAGLPIGGMMYERDKANPLRWQAGLEGLLRNANNDSYANNANLVARGIFNSGERTNTDDALALRSQQDINTLNESVGSGYAGTNLAAKYNNAAFNTSSAKTRLTQQIMDIENARNTARANEIQQAEYEALVRALEAMNANPPSVPVAKPTPAVQTSSGLGAAARTPSPKKPAAPKPAAKPKPKIGAAAGKKVKK